MTRLVTYPEEDLKIKIILVGDSGVGKSNIRSRFCRNKFDPFSYRTVGVEYATRSFLAAIDNTQQKFTACLWDIVGERTNPQLSVSYFKNAMGVIYVYELTSMSSLDNLRSWRAKVQEQLNAAHVVQMLLGNKSDLEYLREVSAVHSRELAKEFGIKLSFEVSALKENQTLARSFYEYFCEIVQQFSYGVKRPVRLKLEEAHHSSCC